MWNSEDTSLSGLSRTGQKQGRKLLAELQELAFQGAWIIHLIIGQLKV